MSAQPTIVRAVPDDSRETLRRAIGGIALLSREVVRLKAELAERDDKLAELQALIHRYCP